MKDLQTRSIIFAAKVQGHTNHVRLRCANFWISWISGCLRCAHSSIRVTVALLRMACGPFCHAVRLLAIACFDCYSVLNIKLCACGSIHQGHERFGDVSEEGNVLL